MIAYDLTGKSVLISGGASGGYGYKTYCLPRPTCHRNRHRGLTSGSLWLVLVGPLSRSGENATAMTLSSWPASLATTARRARTPPP
jgi:hypothetical protein